MVELSALLQGTLSKMSGHMKSTSQYLLQAHKKMIALDHPAKAELALQQKAVALQKNNAFLQHKSIVEQTQQTLGVKAQQMQNSPAYFNAAEPTNAKLADLSAKTAKIQAGSYGDHTVALDNHINKLSQHMQANPAKSKELMPSLKHLQSAKSFTGVGAGTVAEPTAKAMADGVASGAEGAASAAEAAAGGIPGMPSMPGGLGNGIPGLASSAAAEAAGAAGAAGAAEAAAGAAANTAAGAAGAVAAGAAAVGGAAAAAGAVAGKMKSKKSADKGKPFACMGAILKCQGGTGPATMMVLPDGTLVMGRPLANPMSSTALNVPTTYIMCHAPAVLARQEGVPAPCIPVAVPWTPPVTNPLPKMAINKQCTAMCPVGASAWKIQKEGQKKMKGSAG